MELRDGEPNVVTDEPATCSATAPRAAASSSGLAPEVELVSVRVLGADLKGKGAAFLAGLEWAIERGVQVANLSLSSKSEQLFPDFHEVVDEAYFKGVDLVSAANNVRRRQLSVAVLVGLLGRRPRRARPVALVLQPQAAGRVRRLGRGRADRLEGRRLDGGHRQQLRGAARRGPGGAASPSKHPGLTPFEVKAVLAATADNPRPDDGAPVELATPR